LEPVAEQLKKAQQQVQLYADAMESLHADLEEVEKENSELKKNLVSANSTGDGYRPSRRVSAGGWSPEEV
jgi:prefoldin subunit 5